MRKRCRVIIKGYDSTFLGHSLPLMTTQLSDSQRGLYNGGGRFLLARAAVVLTVVVVKVFVNICMRAV